jgi:hypothetical protein
MQGKRAMNKTVLRTGVAALLMFLGFTWGRGRQLSAEPQAGSGQAACVSYVPRAWGQYRGGSQQSGLAFEEASGTLRFITNVPCDGTPQVALELRRTPANPSSGN